MYLSLMTKNVLALNTLVDQTPLNPVLKPSLNFKTRFLAVEESCHLFKLSMSVCNEQFFARLLAIVNNV